MSQSIVRKSRSFVMHTTLRRVQSRLPGVVGGAMLAAFVASPAWASGTDVSDDEVYSDDVTLTTYDGQPLDLNDDGHVDLAVATNFENNIAGRSRYYLGNGDGTFGAAILLGAGGGGSTEAGPASDVLGADLNDDGGVDLILARRDRTNFVFLNENDDSGNVQSPLPLSADTRRHLSIALGDLDGDGDLDMVIGTGHPGGVAANDPEPNLFCLNDWIPGGNLTYICADISADADDTRGIALADIDRDGWLDVIVGNDESTPNSNRVYRNLFESGVPGFAPGVDFGDPDDQTSKILVADLNGDDLPDIVTINNVSGEGQPGDGRNRFFLNESTPGNIALSGANDIGTDTDRSSGGVLADFDGDGDLDLAVANIMAQNPGEQSRNRLYLNQFEETGTVSFSEGLDISADEHPSRELDAADLNGDGLIDLVVGNQNPSKDRVYLNNGNPADPFGEPAVNTPPGFTSVPVTSATAGVAYTYTITASDDDSDPLTFAAGTKPAWLTLTDNGDGTATLAGTPDAADVGNHPVSLQVSDGVDGDQQDFTITVASVPPDNDPPSFTSTAVLEATEDAAYTYNVTAEDSDNDTLTITAPTLPDWLELTDNGDGTATLTGTPGESDVGDHDVSLQVSDGNGGTDVQDFTITVEEASAPPPPPPPPPPSSGGGGGGSLGFLTLLALGAVRLAGGRRRMV